MIHPLDDPEIGSRAMKNCLNKTTKGKLKWTGDYESLQIFVDNNLAEFNGIWTTPRGGCKELKHPRLLLRWYSNTQSLILDGEYPRQYISKTSYFYLPMKTKSLLMNTI